MNTTAMKSDVTQNVEHAEGPVAKAIENQTAKLPSDTFLWLAFGSIGASLAFQLFGRKETSNFIGQWAPTLLILGLYNKIVKVAGSDQVSGGSRRESFDQDISRTSAAI